MRVFSGELAHETNTFCHISTDEDCFRRSCYLEGQEVIDGARRGTRSGFGAVYEACEKYGWDLSCNLAATANPSGALTSTCFETMVSKLLKPLTGGEERPDGVLLMLHGAMVSENFEDSEGEIVKRCREYVGPQVPILVTLDLHGNITQKMVDHANCYIAVRTYPHIDFYEMAWKAADLLELCMNGEVQLQTVIARRPTLRGLDGGRSQRGPMRDLLDRADKIEQDGIQADEGVCNYLSERGNSAKRSVVKIISICAGFTAADIYDCGPSVTVTVDANQQKAEALLQASAVAETFMDYVWETRAYTSVNHMSPEDLVSLALKRQAENSSGQLLAAEVTDNPGSGHYGDATNVLRCMVRADPPLKGAAFYAICDPEAVKAGASIGVGNTGTIVLGGKQDSKAGGPPLTLTGRVVSLTDGHFLSGGPVCGGTWQSLGLSMLFRDVCGVEVCVITNNAQALDTSQMRSLGCHPEDKRFIVVKSAHHFRADFGPIAESDEGGMIVTVDGGGLGSVILKTGKFEKIRRPVWPLDPDVRGDEQR